MNKRLQNSLDKTRVLCEWVSKHAGYPYLGPDKNTEEYKAARWLCKRRYSIKCGFSLPPEEIALLEEYGLPDLFNESSNASKSASMLHVYSLWMLSQGSEPKPSGSPLEMALYRWASRQRTGESKSYPDSSEDLLVPNVLAPNSRESLSNYMALRLSVWVSTKGMPARRSQDEEERELARWLANKRQGAKGNSRSKVYPSDTQILDRHGLGHLLR